MLRLPDIHTEHAAGYMVALLHEAGLMSSSGMGPVPLSWLEIDAWMRVTETKLSVWEKLTLKQMSDDYVSELIRSKEKDRPAPYTFVDPNADAEQVSSRMLNVLRGFGKKPVIESEQKEPA